MSHHSILSELSNKFTCMQALLGELGAFVWSELWPVKGRKYFTDKAKLVEKIAADRRAGRFIYLIYVLFALSFLVSIVQCFYHQPTFVLLTFDYGGYNNLPWSIKMSRGFINIAAFYFYHYLYFQLGSVKQFPNVREILFQNKRAFVLGSQFDFWKLILWALGFYQLPLVGLELTLLSSYFKFCVALSSHRFPSNYLRSLAYLSMSIFFGLYCAPFLLVCIGGFAGGIALYGIRLLFERIKIQSRRYLQHPINRWTTARLLKYREENTRTMDLLFGTFSMYGSLLLIFMITNLALNISFITVLIFKNVSSMLVYYRLISAVLGQITVIVFFHYIGALVSNKLHKPYKTIHSQFVHSKTSNLRAQLRVALNIQTFLVKKRYGILYKYNNRSYGLITLMAFFKFLLFYLEMILCSYSLHLQQNTLV